MFLGYTFGYIILNHALPALHDFICFRWLLPITRCAKNSFGHRLQSNTAQPMSSLPRRIGANEPFGNSCPNLPSMWLGLNQSKTAGGFDKDLFQTLIYLTGGSKFSLGRGELCSLDSHHSTHQRKEWKVHWVAQATIKNSSTKRWLKTANLEIKQKNSGVTTNPRHIHSCFEKIIDSQFDGWKNQFHGQKSVVQKIWIKYKGPVASIPGVMMATSRFTNITLRGYTFATCWFIMARSDYDTILNG